MIVIGLSGSPRRSGNTETLLDRALAGAEAAGASTEKIVLCDYQISGCIECNDCFESGTCTLGDEMDSIYEAIERADRIIIASPIFFMGLTSQMKTVIDRCQCYWALKYVLKEAFPRKADAPERLGSFIGVGGTRGENLFEGAMKTLKYFFDAISTRPREDLYVMVRGIDDKGEIEAREDALQEAYESGRALAESA
ncbi:MAG: flavodoxin family protein [Actinobacteria bacterium]|nr:flavodoxin family protein [Actinomycetota bacterium]